MYPFMRNHNIFPNPTIKEGRDQEFYNLGEGLLNSARLNVKLRYSLIKYFHSVFLRRRGIGAVI
jgi:alpha-glucosidase/lysosomal alpha-glucosidase